MLDGSFRIVNTRGHGPFKRGLPAPVMIAGSSAAETIRTVPAYTRAPHGKDAVSETMRGAKPPVWTLSGLKPQSSGMYRGC